MFWNKLDRGRSSIFTLAQGTEVPLLSEYNAQVSELYWVNSIKSSKGFFFILRVVFEKKLSYWLNQADYYNICLKIMSHQKMSKFNLKDNLFPGI